MNKTPKGAKRSETAYTCSSLLYADDYSIWFVTSIPRYVSILGGIVGAAWWVFRIVHYQIHKNEIRKR